MDGKERTIDKLRAEMEKYKVTDCVLMLYYDKGKGGIPPPPPPTTTTHTHTHTHTV